MFICGYISANRSFLLLLFFMLRFVISENRCEICHNNLIMYILVMQKIVKQVIFSFRTALPRPFKFSQANEKISFLLIFSILVE